MHPNPTTTERLAPWLEVDGTLFGHFKSPEEALESMIQAGLARRANELPFRPYAEEGDNGGLWLIEPARDPELLIPGLVLCLDRFTSYGGNRLYVPLSEELREDTGEGVDMHEVARLTGGFRTGRVIGSV